MTRVESFIITPDWLLKAANPTDTPDRRFVQSTVTSSDVSSMKWSGERTMADMVKRATHWIDIGARINASQCSSARIRMYRKTTKRAQKVAGTRRVVERKRLHYLRNVVLGKGAIYASDADNIEEVTDHPALDLLANPNPIDNGSFFAYQRFLWKELAGNAFIQVVGQADGLYMLAASKTAIIPSRTNFVDGYRYGTSGETKEIFSADEVIHLKHAPSPFSPYLGWAWVEAVILDADRFQASTQNDLAMWLNSSRPDYVVSMAPGSGEAQVIQMREQLQRRLRGPQKNHEFFVGTVDDIKPLQWSPKDLEGVASRQDAKEIILAAAGVPLTFVELSDSNKASSLSGNAQYARLTMLPRLCRDADDLTAMLLTRYGLVPGEYWFCYDNPIPEDEAAETTRAQILTDCGILTINDQLSEMGYDQIDAAIGDVRRYKGVPLDTLANMNATGVDGTGTTLEAKPGEAPPPVAGETVQDTAMNGAQVASLVELLNTVAMGDLPKEAAAQAIRIAFPRVTEEQANAMLAKLEGFEPASVQREADAAAQANEHQASLQDAALSAKPPVAKPKSISHADVVFKGHCSLFESNIQTKDAAFDNIDAGMPDFEGAIQRWFSQMLPRVIASVGPEGPTFALNSIPAKEALSIVLTPQIEQTFRAGYNFGATELGQHAGNAKPLGPALTDGVAKYLREYKGKTIQSVTDTADAQIRGNLAEGIEAGESVQELTTRVQNTVTDMKRNSAERIARTESANAYMAAREKSWIDSGNVWGKKWLLAPDACPFCVEAAKQFGVQPLGKDFFKLGDKLTVDGITMSFDYKAISTPPLHPFDRCSMVMVMEKPE